MVINPKKTYNYFVSNFELRKSTKGWYRFTFPSNSSNHSDFSAAFNPTLGIVKDHRSGYCNNIINFIKEFENLDYKDSLRLVDSYSEAEVSLYRNSIINTNSLELPEGFKSLLEDSRMAKRARKYLTSRGFDIEALDYKGFGFVFGDYQFNGRIIIPFKSSGKLVYYIGRDFTDSSSLKYMNISSEISNIGKSDLLYNEDALGLYSECYLTEGWADAETIGDNCVASLGWSLSRTQVSKIIKSSVENLIIVPDRGTLENTNMTFYQKALQVGLQFIDHKNVFVLDIESINSTGKDANEIGKDLILDLRNRTEKLTYKLAINLI